MEARVEVAEGGSGKDGAWHWSPLQVCANELPKKVVKAARKEPKVRAGGLVVPEITAAEKLIAGDTIYAVISSKKFGDWSDNSFAIFEELSTTVVAGMQSLTRRNSRLHSLR